MVPTSISKSLLQAILRVCLIVFAPLLAISLSGCLVAGYSTNGGGFIWPGGLGLLLLIVAILFFVMRSRR